MRMLSIAFVLCTTVSSYAHAGMTMCYSRTYTKAHLAKNPKQILSQINLRLDIEDLNMQISGKLKSNDKMVSGSGGCWVYRGNLNCGPHSDAGDFAVDYLDNGDVLIRVNADSSLRLDDGIEDDYGMPKNPVYLNPGKDNGIYRLKEISCRNHW